MSHRKKDTDYLAISARIRAMENRLLTRERMDRMIEARDNAEAMKLLAECGYNDAAGLDEAPMVYKDIHAVMAAQHDLVDILATFQPRLVKMARDEPRHKRR